MPDKPAVFSTMLDPDAVNKMPERALLAAVLSKAILDATSTTECDSTTQRDARLWLSKPNYRQRFSAGWICEHLDLNYEQLLNAIDIKCPGAVVRFRFARIRRATSVKIRRPNKPKLLIPISDIGKSKTTL